MTGDESNAEEIFASPWCLGKVNLNGCNADVLYLLKKRIVNDLVRVILEFFR